MNVRETEYRAIVWNETGSRQGTIVSYCEHDEHSGSIKVGNFLTS
jgi:hypothetical protein